MTKNQTHNEATEAFIADQAEATKPAKAVTTRYCNCGCGEATSSSKTNYKPGHDARHVGIVARDIASSAQPFFERVTSDEDLPSEKLRAKAHAMAERLLAKATKTPQDRKPQSEGKAKKADKKATAALVAQEEIAHAAEEASKVPEPMWNDDVTVRVGRWDYPARYQILEDGSSKVERNTKRDGSGEWIHTDASLDA